MNSLKKSLTWIFAAIVAAQAYIGFSTIDAAVDAIKTGTELKFRYRVDDIYDRQIKESKLNMSLRELESAYSLKLDFVEKRIREQNKKCEHLVAESFYKKIPVSLRAGKDGFAEISAYGERVEGENCVSSKLTRVVFAKGDKGKKEPLAVPVAAFGIPSLNMTFSEKSLENISAYIKTIPEEERRGYVVARVKNGKIFATEAFVNGKSLKEIGVGKL